MSRISDLFLCAVIVVMMIAAGCTFGNNSGPGPLAPDTTAPVQTQVTSAPTAAGTMPPATAGTQSAGTCNADIMNDESNCGGCGYLCPANADCMSGQCFCKEGFTVENNLCVAAPAGATGTGCPGGMSPCPDGYCYELSSSPDNCGICGNQCPAGMICSASTCTNIPVETTAAAATTAAATTTAAVTTAAATTIATTTSTGTLGPFATFTGGGYTINCVILGKTYCDGTCVNLSTNNGNCGSCGHICSGLTPTCCDGTCTSLKSDESNCGSCGHKCSSWTTCENGSCKVKVAVTSTLAVTPLVTAKVTVPKIVKQFELPGY